MSKLIEQVAAVQTGRRFPSHTDVIEIVEEGRSVPYTGAIEYRIGVTFGATVTVSSAAAHERDVGLAILDVRRWIVQAVYGEFRDLLMEIRQAIYRRDETAAFEKLAVLEKQMFEVDP